LNITDSSTTHTEVLYHIDDLGNNLVVGTIQHIIGYVNNGTYFFITIEQIYGGTIYLKKYLFDTTSIQQIQIVNLGVSRISSFDKSSEYIVIGETTANTLRVYSADTLELVHTL